MTIRRTRSRMRRMRRKRRRRGRRRRRKRWWRRRKGSGKERGKIREGEEKRTSGH